MLEARAAAGACWDLKFLCRVEQRLLQPSVQVLVVGWVRCSLVVQFIPPDVVILSGRFSLNPVHPRCVVVMVDVAVALVFVMMMYAVAVTVLIRVIKVCSLINERFLRVQRGPVTLWCSAVLPHLVHEEYFGHIVNDEHLGPVRHWLGLSSTEMNVHDKDGERGGGCDHCHGGYVVLPYTRGQRRRSLEGKQL